MPNRRSCRSKKRTPKRESPTGSNRSSRPSKADCQELKAGMVFPVPSREPLVDHSKVSSNGDVQDPEHIDSEKEQVREAVRNSL